MFYKSMPYPMLFLRPKQEFVSDLVWILYTICALYILFAAGNAFLLRVKFMNEKTFTNNKK